MSLVIDIQRIAFGGDGVGHLPDGKVCFVPFTLPGEQVEIQILSEKKRYATGKLLKVLEASEKRSEDFGCSLYTRCGGCHYRHCSYDDELRFKTEQFEDLLKRIAGLDAPEIKVIGSPRPEGYRNSLSLHRFKDLMGFYAVDGKTVLDLQSCPQAQEDINQFWKEMKGEILGKGIKELKIKSDGQKIAYSHKNQVLEFPVGQRQVKHDIHTFFQVNSAGAQLLLDELSSMIPGGQTLFDLYCGVGLFSLAFASQFKQVVGLEHQRKAVFWAQQNKEGLNHLRFYKGKVEEKFAGLYERFASSKGNTILVDPPRKGLEPSLAQEIANAPGLERMVYVSCDAATFSRDLKILLEQGSLKLKSLTLLDLFARTKHFEVIACLESS